MRSVNGSPSARIPAASALREFDNNILCDLNDGRKIIVITTYSTIGVPTTLGYELDGTPYAGLLSNLIQCPDVELESDAIVMCSTISDPPVTRLRWILKRNGQPTGVSYDSTLAGSFIATDPNAVPGACPLRQPTAEPANGAHIVVHSATTPNTTIIVPAGVTYTSWTVNNASKFPLLINPTFNVVSPQFKSVVAPNSTLSMTYLESCVTGMDLVLLELPTAPGQYDPSSLLNPSSGNLGQAYVNFVV